MKKYLLGAAFVLVAQPALAQSASVTGVREARPAAERVAPVPRDRDTQTNREKAGELLNHAYRRAHNAVENGASPERVRHALQEYKQQLRERLYGGE